MADEYSVQDLPQVQGGQMNTTDPNTGMFNQNPHQALGGGIGAMLQLSNQLQGAKLSDQMMAQRQLIAHMQAMKEQEAQRSNEAEALQRQFIQDHPEGSIEDYTRSAMGLGAGTSLGQIRPYGVQSLKSQTSAANVGARSDEDMEKTLVANGVSPAKAHQIVLQRKSGDMSATPEANAPAPKVQSGIDLSNAKIDNLASKTNLTDIVASWKPDVFASQIGLNQAGAQLKHMASQVDAMKIQNGGQIPANQADKAIKSLVSVQSQISSIQSRLDNNLMMNAKDKAAARASVQDLQTIADAMRDRITKDKSSGPSAPVRGTATVVNAKDPLGVLPLQNAQ